jgi:hypothetical protein
MVGKTRDESVRALTGTAKGGREGNWMSRIKRVGGTGRRGAVRRRIRQNVKLSL